MGWGRVMAGSWFLQDEQLELGEITLGQIDDAGVEWFLGDLRGWEDAPASTSVVEQRSGDHGGWSSAPFYTSRLIEVDGWLTAPSVDDARWAVRRLMAAIPLALGTMTVRTPYDVLQADVRQEGDPLSEQVGNSANFSLSLLAPDPRRYSETVVTDETGLSETSGGLTLPLTLPLALPAVTTAGVLVVENEGNMDSPPTLTVTGPCPPFSITHGTTGQTLRYHEHVAAGRSLVIDVARGEALLDGVTRYMTGSWFTYAPGVNKLAFNAASYTPAARLTSSHRHAYK